MTINYSVEVDKSAIAEAIDLFEFVGGNSKDALRIAINKTLPKMRTASSREIRKQVRLSASYVNERLTVRRATVVRLSGAISAPVRGLLLSRFSTDASIASDGVGWIRPPLVPRAGIKVKVKPDGPAKPVLPQNGNKPFYIVLNGGQNVGIAIRQGASRKGIDVLSGPSLGQVFNTVRNDVRPQAAAELQAQLVDAMRYLVVKKYPPEPVL